MSGDCERPGVYEYPLGVSVREVLEDAGARGTIAVQAGGPSGACLGQDEFQRRIAFEDIETGGAFIVFDGSRDMFEVARHFAHFFAEESCGFCTPCRVGTSLLRNLMDKIRDGKGSQHDLLTIEELGRLLGKASHCGLGESAAQAAARHVAAFPSGLRASPRLARPSSPRSTSTARSRARAG